MQLRPRVLARLAVSVSGADPPARKRLPQPVVVLEAEAGRLPFWALEALLRLAVGFPVGAGETRPGAYLVLPTH